MAISLKTFSSNYQLTEFRNVLYINNNLFQLLQEKTRVFYTVCVLQKELDFLKLTSKTPVFSEEILNWSNLSITANLNRNRIAEKILRRQ